MQGYETLSPCGFLSEYLTKCCIFVKAFNYPTIAQIPAVVNPNAIRFEALRSCNAAEEKIGGSVEQKVKETEHYDSTGEGKTVFFEGLVYRNEKKVNFVN